MKHLNTKSVQYYFFGLIPKFNFSSKFSVSADIQYSVKGYESVDNIILGNTKHQNVYLDFIPKAEYHVLDFLAVGLGFNIGVLLDEKIKVGEGDWSSAKEFEAIKSSDFGLVGSV